MSPRRRRGLAVAAALVSFQFAFSALAAPGPGPDSPPPAGRPRLILVLSGGGARGAAHIGVLKVLEEMRIPVDGIVGTSMGSIVGGLYATGWSPEEIQKLLEAIDWTQILSDRPKREEKSFRRKMDDVDYLIQTKLRLKGLKPYLPSGLLAGQRLELLLRSIEIQSTGERDFDRFPIPYRAVATDIADGSAVVIDRGSVATAMRASMAVPAFFTPVDLDGRTLVDGGLAANLPVRIAKGLGADAIIAVDITSPLAAKEQLSSFLGVLNQQSSFLLIGNRQEDLKRLDKDDVLVRPELGDITFSDFRRATEAVAIGESAARAKMAELKRFSVSEAEYEAFRKRHHRRPESETRVDEIRLKNESWVSDDVVRSRLHVETGKPLDAESFRKDVGRLAALEYFGTIRHSLDRTDGRGVLDVDVPEKGYGRNSIQFGFNFLDDFQGNSDYSLSIRHQLLAVNRRGGEWQNVAQIGRRQILATEFYQPFDAAMRWFVDPSVASMRTNQLLWTNGDPVAEYRLKELEGRLDAGRVLGEWGELRLGAFLADRSGDVRIGLPQTPAFDETDGGLALTFRVDTRNSTVFPTSGIALRTTYSQSLEDFGADNEYRKALGVVSSAMSFGGNTFNLTLEMANKLRGPDTFGALYSLGGPFRLSGLGLNELLGTKGGLARAVYYRQVAKIDLGVLSTRVYTGLSLEAGGTFSDTDIIGWDTLRYGGALFLGADTFLGPLYLGYGMTDGGRQRFFLSIGSSF